MSTGTRMPSLRSITIIDKLSVPESMRSTIKRLAAFERPLRAPPLRLRRCSRSSRDYRTPPRSPALIARLIFNEKKSHMFNGADCRQLFYLKLRPLSSRPSVLNQRACGKIVGSTLNFHSCLAKARIRERYNVAILRPIALEGVVA